MEPSVTGLEGRVVLVTGAARGIGAAVADAFGAAGAAVAIGDVDAGGATTVAARVGDTHGVATLAVELDVTSRPDVDAALAKVQAELGPLDVLVNSAAVNGYRPFETFTRHDMLRVYEVNVIAPWMLMTDTIAGMRERRRGWILNLTSFAAELPWGPPFPPPSHCN